MKKQAVLEKFDKAVEMFLRENKGRKLSKSAQEGYELILRCFRRFWDEAHGEDEEVNDFGYLDFQMWRDDMEDRGLSDMTISQYLTIARAFFAFASDEDVCGLYPKNPVSARLLPETNYTNRPYDDILTDEQVLKLWDNTPIHKRGVKVENWPRNYAMVILMLTTELRNKEVLDLKVSDLDFEYGEIQVMHGKGDKYRCVDFPEIAQSAVKLYLKSGLRPEGLGDDDYLFGTFHPGGQGVFGKCGTWKRGTTNWLSTIVQRHVKLVTGVDMVRSHDLRHIGARLDLHNGMRAEELQAKLGHANLVVTQIYSGKLGTKRKRVTAKRVYDERDMQARRNEMMLEAM